MSRVLFLLLVAAAVAGCDSKPAVPTDPDSVKKLEELQRKGAQGEK